MFGKNEMCFLFPLILFKIIYCGFTDRFQEPMPPQEAPYAVKINHDVTKKFQANGVLFTPVLVLSTVFDYLKSDGGVSRADHLQVTAVELAGSNTIPTSIKKKQLRSVRKVIIHPNFEKNEVYDISVVWVDKSFVFSDKVHAIDLSVNDPFHGQKCVFASWGPKYTRQEVWPRPYESHGIKSSWFYVNNSASACEDPFPYIHLCANNPSVKQCTDDFGGGLVCDNALVGILVKTSARCWESERKGAIFINLIEIKYFLLNMKRAAKLSSQATDIGKQSRILVLCIILNTAIGS